MVRCADGSVRLRRYLHHLLATNLKPSFLPRLLLHIRTAIFPNNALPPPPAGIPSPEQQAKIKQDCAKALASILPFTLVRAAGLTEEEVVREVEGELNVWGDGYLNRHVAYAVLELVLVRVLPELGEKGVKGLMEGRGVF